MNIGQRAIAEKMNYMIEQVGKGPLTSFEEAELLEILERVNRSSSLWAIAITAHFEKPEDQRDNWALINGLASQCRDDLFTMVCVVGQSAVVYLLRTLQDQKPK